MSKSNCIPLQKGDTVPSDGILIPKKDYEYLTGFEKKSNPVYRKHTKNFR